jgi:hypothetical protein
MGVGPLPIVPRWALPYASAELNARDVFLSKGRKVGIDADMMATFTSICDKRRICTPVRTWFN